MKKILQIALIFLASVTTKADDSIPSLRVLPPNKIQLTVAIGAHNYGLYHTIGYAHLFHLKKKSYLSIYGGLGYLPPKSKQLFAYKIGFDGYKLYAHTARVQYVHEFTNVGFYGGFEYTFLTKEVGNAGDEHQFLGKVGIEFYLFKKHLSISPQLGLGRAHLQDLDDTEFYQENAISYGFDIGFCF
jgi:hypothetical protein